MSELRQHPLTGEWIILAPERGARPNAFDRPIRRGSTSLTNCPFCPGNEHETPPEVFRHGEPWRLRVVPNKYPALDLPHEVIIESSRHGATIDDLSADEMLAVVGAYRDRYLEHARNRDVKYISIFKNEGTGSGQSIDHLHSQLIALRDVPERAKREAAAFARLKRCPFCTLARADASVIARNETLALVAPPFSRFAYEMAIVPLEHEPSFAGTDMDSLARMLQLAIAAMNRKLARPPYNWVVRNAFPHAERRMRTFHWSIEITPRLAQLGGFELGSGMYINIVSPESAAEELRGLLSPRAGRTEPER